MVTDGDITLSCAIHPTYRDVRLILTVQDKRVFEFNSMDVGNVVYVKEKGIEVLEIIISGAEVIRLQVRPSIMINQSVYD